VTTAAPARPASLDRGRGFADRLRRWREEGEAAAPIVMGIVNVTPDSFSDGGRYAEADRAIAHARALAGEGAEILDIGGESTRPGATPVGAQEELRRLLPVIEALAGDGVLLSVDTWKAEVAERALQAGAHIVNDVRGLQADAGAGSEMAAVAARHGAGVVVMHNPGFLGSGSGTVGDPVLACAAFFEKSLAIAAGAGVAPDRIVLDPGFGFGKTLEQNFHLMAQTDALARLGYPVLIGTSRKSFINVLTGRSIAEGLYGTLATNVVCTFLGAAILRVHDVRPHVDAGRVAAKLRAQRDRWT